MEFFRKKSGRTWFNANKLYLFPVLLVLTLVNSTLTVAGLMVILFFFLYSIARARLPINPGKSFDHITREYRKSERRVLKLDIWYPHKSITRYPVVFFAHGGGWVSGFRNQPNNISWCRFLASKGFAVVSIDYRYGFTSTIEEILSDYQAALNFVRKNAENLHLDPENIILMGLSAGGHLALLYASYYTYTRSKDRMSGIRGVVAYYAPSNLRDIFSPEEKSIFARFAAAATLKGTPRSVSESYRYYSPVEWLSERMVPTIIVHGRDDTVVPLGSSVELAERLNCLGVACTFLIHPDAGHGFETKRRDLRTTRILIETVRGMKAMVRHAD